jgi:diguanylate cyclase (GGDEF)-like protein
MINTGKNSVLIVDDDSTNLMALSHILQPVYTIYTAKDGASALHKAEKYIPDLVLLDILMPGMDGYEVIARLQEAEKTKHTPVIFITGLTDRSDERKGLELGAADYIFKPFDDMIVKLRVQHQIQIINQMRTIEHLSTIDQLTDIPNRRAFDKQLSSEWRRAIRSNIPISILILDVDHFKNYNDTYGHQQGDLALQKVAQVLMYTIKRSSDFAARWGGEEFVVLLPNVDIAGSLKIAEKIRKNIQEEDILNTDGSSTKLTISIGVNSKIPTQSDRIDKLLSGADKALYTAKETGRNRVCLFEG